MILTNCSFQENQKKWSKRERIRKTSMSKNQPPVLKHSIEGMALMSSLCCPQLRNSVSISCRTSSSSSFSLKLMLFLPLQLVQTSAQGTQLQSHSALLLPCLWFLDLLIQSSMITGKATKNPKLHCNVIPCGPRSQSHLRQRQHNLGVIIRMHLRSLTLLKVAHLLDSHIRKQTQTGTSEYQIQSQCLIGEPCTAPLCWRK